MKREYPESPIIGVGGVIFSERSVLLVKRAQEPGKGSWSLPGGIVELGETLEDALVREILEEASIKAEICGLVKVIDRIIYDDEKRVRFHYVIADYWGRLVSGVPQPHSDVSEAGFIPIDLIREMRVGREVEEVILMGRKMAEEMPI